MRFLLPACVLLPFLLTIGCGGGDESKPPPDYDQIDTIVYSEHVQPILDASCSISSCHEGPLPSAGLRLTGYEGIAAGSHHGTVVVPHHPERSPLYLHVSGQQGPRMPFERPALDKAAIRFLRRWITEGAAFDYGDEMYSGVARKAFVACQGEDFVAVLDMDPATIRRGLLVHLLDVEVPHSVFVDERSGRLFVSRFETAADNVQAYDVDTLERLDAGRAGTFPALMSVTPDGSQLWVTNFDPNGDHQIRVMDPMNLARGPIKSFALPSVEQPHGLAMTRDGSLVFVTGIASSTISVFRTNLASGDPEVVHIAVPLPGGSRHQPQQCVLSADETRLFVSALGTNMVHSLNVDGVTDLGWVASWDSVDVGGSPWHLAASPSGTELWVANWTDETVTVLDVTSPDRMTVMATLNPQHPVYTERKALQRPMGIAFSPDGTLVYVTNTNDTNEGAGHHPPPEGQKNPGGVAIFDAATHEIVRVSDVPHFARFISFLP